MYILFLNGLIAYSIYFSKLFIVIYTLGYVDNCIQHSNTVLHCLLNCALEYTMDHRGDIGVWVREAAINSLEVRTIKSTNVTIYEY